MMTDGQARYLEYLNSDGWRELSAQVRSDLGNKCQVCGNDKNLNVHHREYPKVWGEEKKEDLNLLCLKCHGKVHEKIYCDGWHLIVGRKKSFYVKWPSRT